MIDFPCPTICFRMRLIAAVCTKGCFSLTHRDPEGWLRCTCLAGSHRQLREVNVTPAPFVPGPHAVPAT